MMGERQGRQERLFYEFCLEDRIPADHLLRRIDKVLDLGWLRSELAPFYSHTGRPSVDPELMIRMLILGYCYSIRSERRLCREVELNLAYRWFCRLGLEDAVPDHSTFSVNRHGRFRESATFRRVFETVVRACMAAISKEVDATETMLERTEDRFGLKPRRIAADVAYGTGEMLGWLVERDIDPHIPVWEQCEVGQEGRFSRNDFQFDRGNNLYLCPNGKPLHSTGKIYGGTTLKYRAKQSDCAACPLKPQCTTASHRSVNRDVDEDARDHVRSLMGSTAYRQSTRERKKIEHRFAETKTTLGLTRLRLRGLTGADDEFLLAAIVQNLKRLARALWTGPSDTAAACFA